MRKPGERKPRTASCPLEATRRAAEDGVQWLCGGGAGEEDDDGECGGSGGGKSPDLLQHGGDDAPGVVYGPLSCGAGGNAQGLRVI